MPMRRFPFTFENLGPANRPVQIRLELGAQANNVRYDPDRRRPKGLAGCEALHKILPRLDHYGRPIHDTSSRSRANLFLYVLDRLNHGSPKWVDHSQTWPRTKHPEWTDGIHEPRSTMLVRVEGWRVVVGHAPPGTRGAGPAREEWLDIMATILRTESRPVLMLTDPNGLGNELVRMGGSKVVTGGSQVEAVHGNRLVVLDHAQTVETLNGVPMRTDHGRCLIGRARLRDDAR